MHRAEAITSARNPLLKEIRRAAAKGELTPSGHCVAESLHLLDEALRSGCEVPHVFIAESAAENLERRMAGLTGSAVHVLADPLFKEIATTEASQGVVALVRPPAWELNDLFRAPALCVILDGVQDPGNAGAIVRAAEAFGATGVVFMKGTVSPFNPKTLRAAAGSLFRLPFVEGIDAAAVVEALTRGQIRIHVTVPRNGEPLDQADLKAACAIVIGSEGRGAGPEWLSTARRLRIPTHVVESLNASVAAAVVLYEGSRQRGLGRGSA